MSDGMDPMVLLQYLQQQPGGLDQYFEPYQQEQDVLNKHMGLDQGLMQGGPQHTNLPGGAPRRPQRRCGKIGGNVLQKKDLGGLSEVGQHMQHSGANVIQAYLKALQSGRMGAGDIDPSAINGLA